MSTVTEPDRDTPLAYFADYEPPADDFLADVLAGFAKPQKELSPKYFYDEAGSKIFDDICRSEDYYVTRLETALLQEIAPKVADLAGAGAIVIEYGSGSSWKIEKLLDALEAPAEYVALDISREHLIRAAENIAGKYPDVKVGAVCADFTEPLRLPEEAAQGEGTRLGFFPGSTIGNLTVDKAVTFLRSAHNQLAPRSASGREGALLIGVDLKKDREVLLRAYNDSEGHTAAFNYNLLTRINRELGADFDLSAFSHASIWNEAEGRIESHLTARRDQTVTIGGETFRFAEGETIHTENSTKYSVEEFSALARDAGFRVGHVWTDADDYFALFYLSTGRG